MRCYQTSLLRTDSSFPRLRLCLLLLLLLVISRIVLAVIAVVLTVTDLQGYTVISDLVGRVRWLGVCTYLVRLPLTVPSLHSPLQPRGASRPQLVSNGKPASRVQRGPSPGDPGAIPSYFSRTGTDFCSVGSRSGVVLSNFFGFLSEIRWLKRPIFEFFRVL